MSCISYRKGYKYQLVKPYETNIGIKPESPVLDHDYIELTGEGKITIKKGYAWDGPSGPTIDTLNFMRGSLIHDALYQLMREGYLDPKKYRESADRLLQRLCSDDGMSDIRCLWVYQGVRLGGGPAADPANEKPIIQAPSAC